MDENQSDDLTLPDITEAEHLGANDVENDHENGDQVNGERKNFSSSISVIQQHHFSRFAKFARQTIPFVFN